VFLLLDSGVREDEKRGCRQLPAAFSLFDDNFVFFFFWLTMDCEWWRVLWSFKGKIVH
jgi:hypothetical protein